MYVLGVGLLYIGVASVLIFTFSLMITASESDEILGYDEEEIKEDDDLPL